MLMYLVRHTPVGVPAGQCYGRTDVPLANDWRAEAVRTWTKIPSKEAARAAVWSSPATRCRALAETHDSTPRIDARLAEMDFGQWEGRQWEKLPAAELHAWDADLANYEVPGGESLRQVSARVGAAFEDALEVMEHDVLVWVSHGGTIRALLTRVLEIPLHLIFRLQVEHGSVSCLETGPRGARVLFINR